MPTTLQVGGGLLCGMLATVPVWAQPLRGFQLAAQTPHFLFYSRNGETIDVDEVERSLWKVQRLLGQELAGRAEYYRYGTPQEVAANLGEYATGVTLGSLRQIHTVRRECHLHEIVHLVAAQIGDPGPFFQEGLAVALSGSKWRGQALARVRLPAALRRQKVSVLAGRFESMEPDTAYRIAGSFVAFLIKTYGVSRVAEFFRASGHSGSPRDDAFRATFGESLDQAGTAWNEGRAVRPGSPPPPPSCCASPRGGP
ncbi:MAG TPA: hypothetical protein VIK51_00095 [Vicinamibacteria bacterium]